VRNIEWFCRTIDLYFSLVGGTPLDVKLAFWAGMNTFGVVTEAHLAGTPSRDYHDFPSCVKLLRRCAFLLDSLLNRIDNDRYLPDGRTHTKC
jgi:hypothetical protein